MSAAGDARQMVLAGEYSAGVPVLAGGQESPPSAPAIGAADIWRVVKQRKLMITIVFCLAFMLVVGATFVVWRFAPQYTSEAYIRLIPPPQADSLLGDPLLPKDYIMHQLATEAARMKDPLLLLDVLALPEIKNTKYYRSFKDDFERCLNDLRDRISATPVRDTYLIRVSISVRDKSEATALVNTLVQRYLVRSRSAVGDEGRERLDTLKNRQAQVERALADKREQIRAARAQRDMPALESDREVQSQMIATLSNTAAELKTREADLEAQLETVRGVSLQNLPLSAEMKIIVESDPVLRYYRQQVEALDIQIDVMRRNRVGENHRSMQELADQRQRYFDQETARREELIDDLRSRQVESLQQERARIRNMQATLREQLAQREAAQRDLDQAIQGLVGLEKDADLLGVEREQIGRQLLEAENQLNIQEKEGRMKSAIAARDAVRPSRPNFITWLGGGFLLSLLAAVGLAFLRELTDQAIRTPLDVTRHGHLSVLGCVPLLDDEEADIDTLELATRRAPQSLVAEAFRQIRAHLTFSGPVESQRVLLITSPRPEDGKTAVAINLAVTFAQTNERTLLIDCNFRRPSVRQAFGNMRPEGLSNVLIGQSTLEELVTRTDIENLDVLSTGPMPPNPAELLSSAAMRSLLDQARSRYARVLLDGPPCLLISDALVIATQVDAVVMVTRAVLGTKGSLRRAREQLHRINARVIGAVLNGVEARPGGYFREQYREFYDYSEQPVVMPELPPGPSDFPMASGPESDDKG